MAGLRRRRPRRPLPAVLSAFGAAANWGPEDARLCFGEESTHWVCRPMSHQWLLDAEAAPLSAPVIDSSLAIAAANGTLVVHATWQLGSFRSGFCVVSGVDSPPPKDGLDIIRQVNGYARERGRENQPVQRARGAVGSKNNADDFPSTASSLPLSLDSRDRHGGTVITSIAKQRNLCNYRPYDSCTGNCTWNLKHDFCDLDEVAAQQAVLARLDEGGALLHIMRESTRCSSFSQATCLHSCDWSEERQSCESRASTFVQHLISCRSKVRATCTDQCRWNTAEDQCEVQKPRPRRLSEAIMSASSGGREGKTFLLAALPNTSSRVQLSLSPLQSGRTYRAYCAAVQLPVRLCSNIDGGRASEPTVCIGAAPRGDLARFSGRRTLAVVDFHTADDRANISASNSSTSETSESAQNVGQGKWSMQQILAALVLVLLAFGALALGRRRRRRTRSVRIWSSRVHLAGMEEDRELITPSVGPMTTAAEAGGDAEWACLSG